MTLEEKFASLLDQCPTTGCWLWAGFVTPHGYGSLRFEGVTYYAHRLSWELHRGPLNGLWVLHHCDVRCCVNPSHLFLGTIRDNALDMVAEKRQACGERINLARLTSAQALEIIQSPESGRCLAKRFGVNQTTIARVKRGETWGHLHK